MRTIWDSQMRQRIIVDHDENGDLARIMVHEQDGERGIAIDPFWAETTTGPMLEPDDVLYHMCRLHPLRVEYTVGGQPSYMWMPWLCNPFDNDDLSSLSGNALPRRCVGYPSEAAPPEQENTGARDSP